jgi:tricorn protease-like protein
LVAFDSSASNLVPGDNNDARDIFVHNRKSGKTKRVNVRSNGNEAEGGEISFPGGSFSLGSSAPSISPNGRFVAFQSVATNLVTGDDNGEDDIFVHDRKNGKTKRVSVRSNGTESDGRNFSPSISADGLLVAFWSNATNLVGGDINGDDDVFVHNRENGKTKRVSVRSNGDEAEGGTSSQPSISANGRFVAFSSTATNLVPDDDNGDRDVFVHNRKNGKTKRVSVRSNGDEAEGEGGSSGSSSPSISPNGRFVAFRSDATNLVTGDNNESDDIFVHDRKNGRTKRVSVRSNGTEAEGGISSESSMSATGRVVAFSSTATNLVGGDANGVNDIFVRGPLR